MWEPFSSDNHPGCRYGRASMSKEISNTDDLIDSHDILARVEHLEDSLERAKDDDGIVRKLADFTEEESADFTEWEILKALSNECAQYSADWEYGECLVRDSYFKTYTQEFCEDTVSIPSDLPDWIEVDWEATARNVQQDYTEVDFDGVAYWVRNS
jgi:hypothetical protein